MKKTIYIEGMKCENCANKVKNSLEEIEGVISCTIKLKAKKAVVELDKDISNNISDNLLKEAVEKNDYTVIKIKKNLF